MLLQPGASDPEFFALTQTGSSETLVRACGKLCVDIHQDNHQNFRAAPPGHQVLTLDLELHDQKSAAGSSRASESAAVESRSVATAAIERADKVLSSSKKPVGNKVSKSSYFATPVLHKQQESIVSDRQVSDAAGSAQVLGEDETFEPRKLRPSPSPSSARRAAQEADAHDEGSDNPDDMIPTKQPATPNTPAEPRVDAMQSPAVLSPAEQVSNTL